ncbi:chemotaxis protein CheW [Aquibium sp. ELW1220]|uniref:chemotaxis protein CheW n=1 Tax=Aquibium sp. ELW1220 TaxID=2976766 RepID=UPI0025B07632|nr:chemotaxis protein CheW [Aquibium sp. ELW1220]MDN2581020.1 chemotaxis protein CheW [Aquibium sp. ELW1220]
MSGTSQFVTLGAAEEIYAAPVEMVQEILELRPISRLPKAPANLLGMIDVRSEGIPVLDLRATLGLPVAGDDENTRIVVLRFHADGRELRLALKTDRVFEVTVLDDETLSPPPPTGRRWDSRVIAGIGRRNGAFVTVLDLDRLFSLSDVDGLDAPLPN